jgi:hypothetical protein
MPNYEEIKRKLETAFNNAVIIENNYLKLNFDKKQILSITHIKEQNEYEITDKSIISPYYEGWIIHLNKFTKEMLPYIKIIPILYTTEAYVDSLISALTDQQNKIFHVIQTIINEESREEEYFMYLIVNINASGSFQKFLKLKFYLDSEKNYDELRKNKT